MVTRHNLMPNPAAGVDLTGWTSSTCSPVRSTGLAGLPRTTGIQSTVGGFFQTPVVPCSPGQQFAVSFYMLNNSGFFQFGHTVYISYKRSGGGDVFPETFASSNTADGAVSRSSFVTTIASVPADVTGIYLVIDSMPANIHITGVQFEAVSAVDTYFDGSKPDATWDGTTDLSASTRVYTPETIAWGVSPTTTDGNDAGQDYNMGLKFSLTQAGFCYGLDWNPEPLTFSNPPGGTHLAQLWNMDTSTKLAEAPFVPNAAGAQQRVYFDTQPALTTGVEYGVTIYTVHYTHKANSAWTQTSPSGRIHADKGLLRTGGATIPNNLQDSIYFVVPVMSFGAAPPPALALSVWNGSAEVGATLSVWTGSAEVPAVLDSVV